MIITKLLLPLGYISNTDMVVVSDDDEPALSECVVEHGGGRMGGNATDIPGAAGRKLGRGSRCSRSTSYPTSNGATRSRSLFKKPSVQRQPAMRVLS